MVRHIILWLIVLLIVLALSPFLTTRAEIAAVAHQEWHEQSRLLGPSWAAVATVIGEAAYNHSGRPLENIAMGTIVVDKVNPDEVGPVLKLGEWYYDVARHLVTLFLLLHFVMLRVSLLLVWLFLLSPITIACILEGRSQHRIRNEEIQVHSPVGWNTSTHAVLLLVFMTIAYFATTLPFPAILYPAWVVLLSACFIPMLANMQRLR